MIKYIMSFNDKGVVMSAGLVSAKVDIDHPTANVTGAHASARSSVEVKDSCNCCLFCFPCFGKKVVKKKQPDPRVANLRDDTIIRPTSMPTMDVDSARFAPVRKSPAYDDMSQFVHMPSQQNVTVTVVCDHSPGTTPSGPSPFISDSSESTGKSQ
jgi:hypothetical protein